MEYSSWIFSPLFSRLLTPGYRARAVSSRHPGPTTGKRESLIKNAPFPANTRTPVQGYGKLTSPTGTIYEGSWREGRKHGKGRLVFKVIPVIVEVISLTNNSNRHMLR